MGGFFGAVSNHDVIAEVFFGTDYHSHLGTSRGGMAAYDEKIGLQREIHNIQNSPFRTKFEHVFDEMRGNAAIGCISDTDPQPLLIRSNLGTYAISTIGRINNADELIDHYLSFSGGHFDAMTGGKVNTNELVAALINQKSTFVEGIQFAQKMISGTASILILTDEGKKLFLRWCDYHKLHIHEDNVNSLEINKWYAGTTDNDLYYVTFDETDIVTQLQELKNLCYTLSYIDSSKIFISNGGVPSDFER